MTTSTATTGTVTRNEWDAARARTVFFGHQSVGENILDGLTQIATAERWPAIDVIESTAAPAGKGVLLHAKIGANGDPSSKITGFRQALEAGAGARADIAVMKFCFWDIRNDTDVAKVFAEYQSTMTEIERRFPNLTLLHATVPLVVEDKDWRARVNRMIGRAIPTDLDNARREALNEKLRATYGDRVFDIARAELDPAGETTSVRYLAESFSSDGAHLNDAGRRHVGAAFVRSIAAVSRVEANQ